jgi:hypothetical protein
MTATKGRAAADEQARRTISVPGETGPPGAAQTPEPDSWPVLPRYC